MRSATESPRADLRPVARDQDLPSWCDRYFQPPGSGDFFGGRTWYGTLIAHGLPATAMPLFAVCGPGDAVLVPLMRTGAGRLRSLVAPYSLDWRPLPAPGAADADLHAAGRDLGRLAFRGRAPARMDTLDPDAPGLRPFLAGLADAGLVLLRYDHFGNWHETLPAAMTWAEYLSARPPQMRTTIRRKMARCQREMDLEIIDAPGAGLEAGIAAYEEVRARSWKPDEPFPDFDAALLRAAAAAGVLRFGILRSRADGRPAAAQYWVLDRGGSRASLLKLAHAEDQRASSPGTALTAILMRRLLDQDGVRELDFGCGDDDYKRLWVGQRRQRIGVAIADPRHPLGLLELARHAAGRGVKWFRTKGA